MSEPLPLATIHDAVLGFLRGRNDAALCRAQAVNAYVDEPRMTQDVDILSPRAQELADEIQAALNSKFHIAVRIREVREGQGFRIYQVKRPHNRHLVDVRQCEKLPPVHLVQQTACTDEKPGVQSARNVRAPGCVAADEGKAGTSSRTPNQTVCGDSSLLCFLSLFAPHPAHPSFTH